MLQMKWILVAAGGIALLSLGSAGALEARVASVNESVSIGQARPAVLVPAKSDIALEAVPEGTHQGGLEAVSQAPTQAPAGSAAGQAQPGPAVVVKPGCGSATGSRKPPPLCPPP